MKAEYYFPNDPAAEQARVRLLRDGQRGQVTAGTDYFWRSGWIRGGRAWYIPQTADEREMLGVCGMYHWLRNPFGLCRVHILTQGTGFDYQVFPQLLRHPVNCRFMPRAEAVAYAAAAPAEIARLCRRVETVRVTRWPEHGLCLELAGRWRRGERYDWTKEPVSDTGYTVDYMQREILRRAGRGRRERVERG